MKRFIPKLLSVLLLLSIPSGSSQATPRDCLGPISALLRSSAIPTRVGEEAKPETAPVVTAEKKDEAPKRIVPQDLPPAPNPDGTHNISILWYPRMTNWSPVTHSDIVLNGRVYNPKAYTSFGEWIGAHRKPRELEKMEKLANRYNQGFIKVDLKVTPEELVKIQESLEQILKKPPLDTCMGQVCAAILPNAKINIPPVIRHVPSLTVLYLYLAKKFGYERVTNIEFVGKKPARQFASLAFVGEASMITGALGGTGYLIFTGLNALGKVISHAIEVGPPQEGNTEDDEKRRKKSSEDHINEPPEFLDKLRPKDN